MQLQNGPTNPGKSLEEKYLKRRYIEAGWHPLYVGDLQEAVILRNRLSAFVAKVDKKPLLYSEASDLLAEVVLGTCPDQRAEGRKFPWLSIVVEPRVDIEQYQTRGFCKIGYNSNGTVYGYYEFRVLVEVSSAAWPTLEDLVEAEYQYLCPDTSYNAIVLDEKWSQKDVEKAVENIRNDLLKEFPFDGNIPESNFFKDGWLTIRIGMDDVERLEKLALVVNDFHTTLDSLTQAHVDVPTNVTIQGVEEQLLAFIQHTEDIQTYSETSTAHDTPVFHQEHYE
ncbi:hypothetical protein FRC07_000337 [Ceratobasidium sp. 392]|nr:hypothetical protein FRC07_000337 [Ceratobasidium sp. 392]